MDGQSGSGAIQPHPQADPSAPHDPAPRDKASGPGGSNPAQALHCPRFPPPRLALRPPRIPPPRPARARPAAVSGGFTPVNNWLDSLPEPEWQRIGDKIYTSPARFKAWLARARAERARAAEERERTRLMDAAHAEALAEAAKRTEAEHAARFRAEQELAEKAAPGRRNAKSGS